MKKLFLITFLLIASMVVAQENRVIAIDSISNSDSRAHVFDLQRVAGFDSIVVNIYAMGEIDLDSLDVKGGFVGTDLWYKNADTDVSIYEALEGATLTINNDSATAAYVQEVAVVTKEEANGYNSLKFTVIGAASGNDSTDPTQKYILFAQVYKNYTFNK